MALTLIHQKKSTAILANSSDVIYKDLIDTSNLWEHDKKLPESKVPILGISAYNHLRKLQGEKAVDLADNQFLVNANYKGTAKQIQDFLSRPKPS